MEYQEKVMAGDSVIQPKGKQNGMGRDVEKSRRRKRQQKMRAVSEREKEHLSGPQPKYRE